MDRIDHKNNYLYSLLLLIYTYMDYWIPCIVIFTFPLWIFPYLLFLIFSKTISIIRYVYTIGVSLVRPVNLCQLYYAVLKGNGRYLKEDCKDVYTQQLYDYTARRFMSISELEAQSRIVELECESDVGLIYLMESNKLGTVVGLQSNSDALKRSTNYLGSIVPCDYSIIGEPANYDCLLLFNLKSKLKNRRCCKKRQTVQLMTLLRFCNFHMDTTGYLVYGDYFQKGEVNTYISLFQAFNFVIAEQEDITKNIEYGEKLMKRRQQHYENQVMDFLLKTTIQLLGRSQFTQEGQQFIVFILQKIKPTSHSS